MKEFTKFHMITTFSPRISESKVRFDNNLLENTIEESENKHLLVKKKSRKLKLEEIKEIIEL